MSKLETPITRWYWSTVGGTLVEGFPLTRQSPTSAGRWVDGLILPDGPHWLAQPDEVFIDSQHVTAVYSTAASAPETSRPGPLCEYDGVAVAFGPDDIVDRFTVIGCVAGPAPDDDGLVPRRRRLRRRCFLIGSNQNPDGTEHRLKMPHSDTHPCQGAEDVDSGSPPEHA